MRWTALGVLVALSLLAFPAASAPVEDACGIPQQASDGWSVETHPESAGFDPGLLCEAVQDFLRSPSNLHGFVVERHGRLVAEAYRTGPDRSTYSLWASRVGFDQNALHDVRSVTKSVVALLWGIAESERTVPPLATPVLDLLPALADLRTGGRERITVADMLCMRSGLAWDESGRHGRWDNDENGLLWRGDRARYVLDRPVSALPGTHFNYNGGLTAVLGLLLEERTGQSLEDYARQRLFEPLGLRDWEWVNDVRGRTRAYTGLRLRPRDVARIGRLVLQGGRWEGRQIVPQAWVQTLLAPCRPGEEYGHHWWLGSVWVRGQQVGWHGALGNGGQRLFVVPSLDLVVVTTAGDYNGGRSIGRVQQNLLQQVVAATREHAGEQAAFSPPASPAARQAGPVEMRAIMRSVTEEDGGTRAYVHLKVVPAANLPFTTLRFRVRDKALVAGLRDGASVKFRAERIDGENTLMAIRAVPACVRFQPCD
ncbi:serine hydrolase [Pseudorhodoferax sp.]|uniref:serine hydrolase n=1 Tax=Pseudorhodoferax sp. TaxID=1993553 RepID=UPI002DD63BDC|nr:serine hydrolase [Pseudorhodoferax sp.]